MQAHAYPNQGVTLCPNCGQMWVEKRTKSMSIHAVIIRKLFWHQKFLLPNTTAFMSQVKELECTGYIIIYNLPLFTLLGSFSFLCQKNIKICLFFYSNQVTNPWF